MLTFSGEWKPSPKASGYDSKKFTRVLKVSPCGEVKIKETLSLRQGEERATMVEVNLYFQDANKPIHARMPEQEASRLFYDWENLAAESRGVATYLAADGVSLYFDWGQVTRVEIYEAEEGEPEAVPQPAESLDYPEMRMP